MARSKATKTKKLTKDLKVSEEKMKKVKGGLNPQPDPPAFRSPITRKIG